MVWVLAYQNVVIRPLDPVHLIRLAISGKLLIHQDFIQHAPVVSRRFDVLVLHDLHKAASHQHPVQNHRQDVLMGASLLVQAVQIPGHLLGSALEAEIRPCGQRHGPHRVCRNQGQGGVDDRTGHVLLCVASPFCAAGDSVVL